MYKQALILALVSLTCACGGTTVSGTVGGHSLAAKDSVANVSTFTANDQTFNMAVVGITDFDKACSIFQQKVMKANSTVLALAVFRSDGQKIAAGTFPVSDGSTSAPVLATASFGASDSTCKGTNSSATGGSITFDSIGTDNVTGSFELYFPNGTLKGSFASPICNFSFDSSSGTPSCQQ